MICDLPVSVHEDSRGLAGHAQLAPRLERRIPEHGECCAGGLDEALGQSEAVLGADSDDGELIGVLSGELLDAGGFPAAGGSMGGPEPQQDGPVRRGEAGQVHGGPGGHVHQLH